MKKIHIIHKTRLDTSNEPPECCQRSSNSDGDAKSYQKTRHLASSFSPKTGIQSLTIRKIIDKDNIYKETPLLPFQRLIHTSVPSKPDTTPAVKMPAPALSPIVMPLVSTSGRGFVELGPPVSPADGLLLLVPPLAMLTGPATFCIRFAWIIDMALICSPTPWLLSHVLFIQWRPHMVFPRGAPEHCPAAPVAEAFSFGMMKLVVNGAICVVAASHRER